MMLRYVQRFGATIPIFVRLRCQDGVIVLIIVQCDSCPRVVPARSGTARFPVFQRKLWFPGAPWPGSRLPFVHGAAA